MANDTNIITEQLPPNYLAEFFAGVPGQNVPGIMPLLNQELVNRISGFATNSSFKLAELFLIFCFEISVHE